MNQSPKNNNDLLEKLQKNIEETTVIDDCSRLSSDIESVSADQLLNRLKESLGEPSETSPDIDSVDEDYDISGFEITETETADATNVTDDSDVLPWHSSDAEEKTRENETDHEQTEFVAQEEAPYITPDEYDESLVETHLEDESDAVRVQLERFFEEEAQSTEEEPDYFTMLDKRASADTSKEQTQEESAPEETLIDEIDSAPTEKIVEDTISAETEEFREDVALVTEIQEDLPEMDPQTASFFFKDSSGTCGECDTYQTLDDTDINLLLAMGSKKDIENAVEFVRVREAKNNFYDPAEDEAVSDYIFAYDGEEYRSPSQTDEIKLRYGREKRMVWRRVMATSLFALLFLFWETLPFVGWEIPVVSMLTKHNIFNPLIQIVLLLTTYTFSRKQLFVGLRGFFVMRPNRYTPLSMLACLNLLYAATIPFIFSEEAITAYNVALTFYLLLAAIGDSIRLKKEMMTFDVVSSSEEKFSLEKSDPTPEISREEKILLKRDLSVEKVSFVGKYFTRTAQRSSAFNEYFVELLAMIVIASFVAIGVAIWRPSSPFVANAALLVLTACLPMQPLFGSYPFAKLSKLLYKHNSAIIGERVDNEYVGTNTVYVDDTEVFGRYGVSISGLRTYNDADFYGILYYALAAFSQVEGSLKYVLENSANEIEHAKSVSLQKISINGIEALVDGTEKIIIGNIDFMEAHNFSVKRHSEDEKKIESGEASILYMAINGTLSAKFYMKYTVTNRFESFVQKMAGNGTRVGVRTMDPNITEQMLSRVRKNNEIAVSVIRPTLNDLVPLGRRSDSSIITAKNSHMISQILTLCGRLKKVTKIWSVLRVTMLLTSVAISLSLIFLDWLSWIPGLAIAAYQLGWIVPALIYASKKIK